MRFLNEATYNVAPGSPPPPPDTLEDDDVINIEEKSPHNLGYGKDPETGEFKSMGSNDAIRWFLDKVKKGVEDEGDEWPTIKEDLEKFFRKIGGVEYKTPFTDLAKDFDDWLGDKEDIPKDEREKHLKSFANIHTAPQDEFDAFIKEMGKEEWDKDNIAKLIKKQKEYKAERTSAENKKEEDEFKDDVKNETVKEIVKKCLNRGMIKENIVKVVKKYLTEDEGNFDQGDIVYQFSE